MNFLPLFFASGVALLASCSQIPTVITITHSDHVQPTTPSHITLEMGKMLPHSGVFGHYMVRQCLLKTTDKGLKIIPEYNYGSPELNGQEYTRLYCVMDFNDNEETPAQRKKSLRNDIKNRKLSIKPVFLNEREYERLSPDQLKHSLVWKLREQVVPTGISGFHSNSSIILLDAERGIMLGKAAQPTWLWTNPVKFLDFMTDSKNPSSTPGQLVYKTSKKDDANLSRESWALINLPYTDEGKFMYWIYSSSPDNKIVTEKSTLPSRSK